MTTADDLAALAALLADRTRAAMCLALLDGRAWTAGELAAHAGVARSTATGHLHRLTSGGLLTEERQGRHRYVRLADATVAQLIEDLASGITAPSTAAGEGAASSSSGRPTAGRGLRAVAASEALRRGRTCYDHLAGRLGVLVTDAMTSRGLLDQDGGFLLTVAGRAWFAETLGADLPGSGRRPAAGRRPTARSCLDWTERRPHLAGAAGAQLCTTFFANGWLVRIGSGRAVRPTPAGVTALRDLLGVDTTAGAPGQ
ncbi:ArsR/SmtB family transcription factor [Actinoplanes couchii]|uniref:Transcriptional regulator n=1 Tax=Actinoplanes couchii TaxID=403638 RepID=A0ABQ3X7T6_9ACTN|nr:helix-turn-helix domain-containing protein [Actinoplanes couchii]MDR6320409.1 DNA-binding transcriptional ArsR family regulator [Actinoplanes couchii]GID54579.1 transcriptional regulator [Actinoplanes couchii]